MLYHRNVSEKGKVTYVPAVIPEKIVPTVSEFDDRELITCGVSLGMTMLMILERTLPEHARNARKLRALQDAIVDLAGGQGKTIEKDMVDYWVDTWNLCMNQMQNGLVVQSLKGEENAPAH